MVNYPATLYGVNRGAFAELAFLSFETARMGDLDMHCRIVRDWCYKNLPLHHARDLLAQLGIEPRAAVATVR